ncbi:MAG: hypothetical protein GY856_28330 [bacterium]|nr:hypothetical protein [bacterium]
MKRAVLLIVALAVLFGCARDSGEYAEAPAETAAPAIKLEVTEPEPLPLPEYQEPSSDEDWAAKVNNKDIEVIQTINIINPVAAYITVGFEQYGERFSPTLQEEWEDTQVQLGRATTLYADCKIRMAAGTFDKQLFLDLEEVWQLLVKTGVAGMRTKAMVDAELKAFAG